MAHLTPPASPIDNHTPELDAIQYYIDEEQARLPEAINQVSAVNTALATIKSNAGTQGDALADVAIVVGDMNTRLTHVKKYHARGLTPMNVEAILHDGGGSGAKARLTVVDGVIQSPAVLLSHGEGYSSVPTVTFEGGNGSGAEGMAYVSWATAQLVMAVLPLAGETIRVGYVTYTFRANQSDITDITGDSQDVLLGVDIPDTVINLMNAMNATIAGEQYIPIVNITAPPDGLTNLPAVATATLRGDSVHAVTLSEGGSGIGYVDVPSVTITVPLGGTAAIATAVMHKTATAQVTLDDGVVTDIAILDGGDGYVGDPIVTLSLSSCGIPATATATVVDGSVTAITITEGGTGHTSVPTITIDGPGTIMGITLHSGGSGYRLRHINTDVEPAPYGDLQPPPFGGADVNQAMNLWPRTAIGINGNGLSVSPNPATNFITEDLAGGGVITGIYVTNGGTGYSLHQNWDYRPPMGFAHLNPSEGASNAPGPMFHWDGTEKWYIGDTIPNEARIQEPLRGEGVHGVAFEWNGDYTNDGSQPVFAMQGGEVLAWEQNHPFFGCVLVVQQVDGNTVRYYGMNTTDEVYLGSNPAKQYSLGDTVSQHDYIGSVGRLNVGDNFKVLFIDVCTGDTMRETPFFWGELSSDILDAGFVNPEEYLRFERRPNNGADKSNLPASVAPFDNNTPSRQVISQWLSDQSDYLGIAEPAIMDLRAKLEDMLAQVTGQVAAMQSLEEDNLVPIRIAQNNMERFRDETLPDHFVIFRYNSPFNPNSDRFLGLFGPDSNLAKAEGVERVQMIERGKNYITPPTVEFVSAQDVDGNNIGAGAAGWVSLEMGITEVEITNPGRHFTSQPDVAYADNPGSNAGIEAHVDLGVHEITIDDWGKHYDDVPEVVFVGDADRPAQATAHTVEGVYLILVYDGGYDFTSSPTVEITGGGDDAEGATATARVRGEVESVDIDDAGSDYDTAPDVNFEGGGGSGAEGYAVVTNGFLTRVQVTASGSGYSSPPDVVFSEGNAVANSVLRQVVQRVTVTNPGTGYTEVPDVTISGGGGQGAAATARVSPVIDRIDIDDSGSGYETEPTISFISDTGSEAVATAHISGVIVSTTIHVPGVWTSAPELVVSGGGGSDGELTAKISNYVEKVTMTAQGAGYDVAPDVNFVPAPGEDDGGATGYTEVSKLYHQLDHFASNDSIEGSYQNGLCHGVAYYQPGWTRSPGHESYANNIYTILGGEIVFVGYDSQFGHCVVVHQDDQKVARYHRLMWTHPDLAAGTRIEDGEFIGQVGSNLIFADDDTIDLSGFEPEPTFYLDIGKGHRLLDSPLQWDGLTSDIITEHYADPLRLFHEGSVGPNPAAL